MCCHAKHTAPWLAAFVSFTVSVRCILAGEPAHVTACVVTSAVAQVAQLLANRQHVQPWLNLGHLATVYVGYLTQAFLHYQGQQHIGTLLYCSHNNWSRFVTAFIFGVATQGYASDLIPSTLIRALLAEVHVLPRLYVVLGELHQQPHHPWDVTNPWAIAILLHIAGALLPLLLFPPPTAKLQNNRDSLKSSQGPPSGPPPTSGATVACHNAITHFRHWQPGNPSRTRRARLSRSSAYSSVLGERFTFNIKIHTEHQPESLNVHSLNNLAQLLESRGVASDRFQGTMVLGAAVLRGCILLSVDTCLPPHPDSGSDITHISVTAEQVLAYAQQVLPPLLTELALEGAGKANGSANGSLAELEPGQYLQLQLGGHTVQASIDPTTQEWVFAATPTVVPTSSIDRSSPHVSLAQPLPATVPEPGTAMPNTHTVTFSAVVKQPSNAYLAVRGSEPAMGLVHDSDKPSMQLWVHCQGQYLHIVVQDYDSVTGRVTALAQVPAAALARHHQPDGPVARLQLLTVELWHSSQQLLGSTPLLVDTAQHMQPTVASRFGWWGLSSAGAGGLVSDVCALTAHTADSTTEAAVPSHQAFVSDLAVWLNSVQKAAATTCCDMCGPATTTTATTTCYSITPAQRAVLARSLIKQATTCGMTSTAAAISAQQLVTLPPLHQPHSLAATLKRTALATGLTRSCTACDQLYYTRLRAHLRHLYLVCTLINTLVYIILTHLAPNAQLSVPAAIQHLVIVGGLTTLRVLAYRSMGPTTATSAADKPAMQWVVRRLTCNGVVDTFAYVVHLSVELRVLLGLSLMDPANCRVSTAGLLMATHSLFFLIAQHVHLWGRLPNWLLRVLVITEAVAHLHCANSCPTVPRWLSRHYSVGATFVVPWVLDKYWRRLLRPGKRVKQSEGGEQQGCQ